MKKHPTRSHDSVFGQLLKLIPRAEVAALATRHGIDLQARTFTAWSHLVTMCFVQFVHAISLNDACDWMRARAAAFGLLGVTAPAKNTLSHANRTRDAAFAEDLFWRVMGRLTHAAPGFAKGSMGKGLLRRFKVRIHAVDSTTISLVANCMDWAAHRARKAAVKAHMRLDLHSFLPSFVVVDKASQHDASRAAELCAGVARGEIVVFDKGYFDAAHFERLVARGVFWVTRIKSNIGYKVVRRHAKPSGKILADEIIRLTGKHPLELRLVRALVEVDGKEREMEFLTNNTEWAASSVCDLYRRRWDIEVFFKQVKQTLKLGSFVGTSLNAIRWQIWTALLVYVLVRFQAWQSKWGHSFARIFCVVRSVLLERLHLAKLLQSYGTASGPAAPEPPAISQPFLGLLRVFP